MILGQNIEQLTISTVDYLTATGDKPYEGIIFIALSI